MGLSVSAKSLGIHSPAGGATDVTPPTRAGTTEVRIGGRVLDKRTSIRQIRILAGIERLSSTGTARFPAVLGAEMATLSVMPALGISVIPIKNANYELLSEITHPALIANPNILDSPPPTTAGSTDILKSIDKSFPDLDDPIRQPDSTTVPASTIVRAAAARLATGKSCSKLVSDLCLINLDPSYSTTTKYFKEPETSPKKSTYRRRDKTIIKEIPSLPASSTRRARRTTGKR
tara:strand:+ start:246 stop:944 length:699 start_codon:yes stop_codon:yes gene_type:complete